MSSTSTKTREAARMLLKSANENIDSNRVQIALAAAIVSALLYIGDVIKERS